jgi:small conductance mechanosensitive channel
MVIKTMDHPILQQTIELWNEHSTNIFTLAGHLVASALIIGIGIALTKGMLKLIQKATRAKTQGNGTAVSLLKGFIRYGMFVICVILILNVFGVNTTSLLAILGAAGIAIGLALKDTLSNIAAGIILMVLGSYHKEEFIEFGSFMGTVKEINLFATILETPDGLYISAPNSSIWGNPVRNYTRNGRRRIDLSIGIAYSDSVDAAFQVMAKIIYAEPRFLKDPAPQVLLQSIESSSVKITIRAWVPVEIYWDVYWELSKTIKAKIEEGGLHIPLPQVRVS